MKLFAYLFVNLSLIISGFLPLPARTFNIPVDYETIQAGMDAAQDGDTVLIQPGRYVENLDFRGKPIVVGGRYIVTGDTADIDSTIIDGNQNGAPIVVFNHNEDERSVLTGITITNGLAEYGGGVYIRGASPTLSHLIIENNWTERTGGGIHCTGGAAPVLRRMTLRYNQSRTGGGGISCFNQAHPTLINVSIIGNSNAGTGGGIFVSGNSSLTMDSCIVSGNTGFYGGAVAVNLGDQDSVTIRRTLIASNSAGARCSILYGTGGIISFDQVTFADNFQGQLQMQNTGSRLTFYNSILWDIDGGGIITDDLEISYCDVEGDREAISAPDNNWVWGEGNIDADPLFVDPENGDYRLTWRSYPDNDQFKSPGIDSGDPDSPPDPDGTR
ncbi:MAG: right-handed parallel beta-helix repeat-containing protein, partial [Calditrichota bacterium]